VLKERNGITITMNIALLIFRVVIGLTLAGHGAKTLSKGILRS
jgi:hypothetical protein